MKHDKNCTDKRPHGYGGSCVTSTPIESPEEKCCAKCLDCPDYPNSGGHGGYCHNKGCSCHKDTCLEGAECKAPCEEEKGGWEERFEDKFLNVLTWIKISNPNEIISGVDINHLPNELKSFLRSELATAKQSDREEIAEEIRKGLLAMGAVSINGSEMLVELEKVLALTALETN